MPERGLLAEFATPEALLAAVRALKGHGYRDLETYTPFDVPGLSAALGLPRQRLPRAVFAGGFLGGAAAYAVQWWTNAVSYPVNAGGRPMHAVPAFIFPTFEALVLAGSAVALFGCFALLRFPDLWHPVVEVEGFERASVDRYFLELRRGAGDQRAEALLAKAGAIRVVPLGCA